MLMYSSGPNWIHGGQDNPISVIAESTKTKLEDFDENQVVFSRDGKPLDEILAAKVSDFVWTTIEEAFEYSNTYKDSVPSDRSLFDFFKESAEKKGFSEEEKEACLESCRLWGSYVGDPVERQSLKFFCLEECIDSSRFDRLFTGIEVMADIAGNCFVSSTYKKILEFVSKAALKYADILFNQPVVGIDSQFHEAKTERQVVLSIVDGQKHQFDEVVVTCPLGWLKRNKSAFTPELPPRLIQAIDSISYGRLEKVYVTFPQAFWHTEGADYKAPNFAVFLDPTYTDHPKDIIWNQECVSLATLGPQAHPTLLFYIHGPCASHVVSRISTLSPSSAEYYDYLNDFLHPFYSRLHGYSATSADCKPLAFLATQWQSDPYAGNGSYSNFQVGLEKGDQDIEALRDGAGIGEERGVWFAGEHTAPFVALGTTTGAYWSGERVAGRICQIYGLDGIGIGTGRDDSLPSQVSIT